MTSFDPAAATAAYLSVLTPEAHAKATAYTQGGHWLLLWGALVGLVISWIVLRTGLLVKIRAWINGKKSRPWLAALMTRSLGSLSACRSKSFRGWNGFRWRALISRCSISD